MKYLVTLRPAGVGVNVAKCPELALENVTQYYELVGEGSETVFQKHDCQTHLPQCRLCIWGSPTIQQEHEVLELPLRKSVKIVRKVFHLR